MAGAHGVVALNSGGCDGSDGSAVDELFPFEEDIPFEEMLDMDFQGGEDPEGADNVVAARAEGKETQTPKTEGTATTAPAGP